MYEIEECKTCTVSMAVSVISLAADQRCTAGVPLDAKQIVEIIDSFCDEVPSQRWKDISAGVIEKLEFWQIISADGELKGLY
jgi:hypothetical protein